MTITVNIYKQPALMQLAANGLVESPTSAADPSNPGNLRFILSTSGNDQFNANFNGTMQQLLANGVTELPTGNGYQQKGIPVSLWRGYNLEYREFSPSGTPIFLNTTRYYSSIDSAYVKSTVPGGVQNTTLYFTPPSRYAWPGRQHPWYPSVPETVDVWRGELVVIVDWGKTLAFKSIIIYSHSSSTGAIDYNAAYPVAMIDFGATQSYTAPQKPSVFYSYLPNGWTYAVPLPQFDPYYYLLKWAVS